MATTADDVWQLLAELTAAQKETCLLYTSDAADE